MKISVITTVLNRRDTVAQAIESVLAQTGVDLEYIVIDGGSSDGTEQILRSYQENIAKLVIEPDGGIYDALNKGISIASGDIVGFLHADDLLPSNRVLFRIARAFDTNSVDAVYGDLVYVRKDDPNSIVRYWRAGTFARRKLMFGWMPPHPTVYFRRKVYAQYGGFDATYRIAADYDLILRFFGTHGIASQYIPEVLYKMRVGGASNRSIGNLVAKTVEDWRAIRRNSIGGVHTLVLKNLLKASQFINRPAS